MNLSSEDSLTFWIRRLGENSPEAARRVWEHYHPRLLGLAARLIATSARGPADEEDVVASAFESLFEKAGAGKLRADTTRDDLWRLLARIVDYKATSHLRRERRVKRGGKNQPVTGHFEVEYDPLEATPSREIPPALAVELADSIRHLTDSLRPEQRKIVALKLEGLTDLEAAEKADVSEATVGRCLKIVRTKWKEWLDRQEET